MMLRLFALFLGGSIVTTAYLSTASAQDEPIAEAIAEAVAEADTVKRPALRPLTVTVGLTDDTIITGTLIDSTSVAIRTAFGEASIPLTEVAGVRFPAAEDTSTTVVMLNGDSITGATDLKFVGVETTWGSAKINGQNVLTMLFVPGLEWKNTEALGGKRWMLTEAMVAAAPQPITPTQNNFNQSQAGFPSGNSPQVIFGR
jgi:hypothetical protein